MGSALLVLLSELLIILEFGLSIVIWWSAYEYLYLTGHVYFAALFVGLGAYVAVQAMQDKLDKGEG